MKTTPTLIDAVYRASFNKETNDHWRSNFDMRKAIESSRRFVADDRMSAFMADLANEAFLRAGMRVRDGDNHRQLRFEHNAPLVMRTLESLRVSARLPHEAIWIEYRSRAYQHRSNELRGTDQVDDRELSLREGWLIQQHPQISTAHIMHLFSEGDDPAKPQFRLWTFPLVFAWCSDDSPLPWRTVLGVNSANPDPRFTWPSSYLTGIAGFQRDNVGVVRSPLITDPKPHLVSSYSELLHEWTGTLRRVWALLATIDHLPVLVSDVRQSKGFLARGRIRPYLGHCTITLNIPAKKDTRVVARQAIAIAHRKRHEVRGHWRNDWRNPPSRRCNPHLWECVDDNADLICCTQCRGRQIYIHKHERGDASIGYVTHDYQLRHEEV